MRAGSISPLTVGILIGYNSTIRKKPIDSLCHRMFWVPSVCKGGKYSSVNFSITLCITVCIVELNTLILPLLYCSVCVSCLITTGPKRNGKSASVKSRSVPKSTSAAARVSGIECKYRSHVFHATRRVASGKYSSLLFV